MQNNQLPTNDSRKKLHLQKPNHKIVAGIFALFVIALVFILLYIFVLQEENNTNNGVSTNASNGTLHQISFDNPATAGYDAIVAEQSEYEFIHLGNGPELFAENLNKGVHLCEFAVKGHPNADALFAEFEEKIENMRHADKFDYGFYYDNRAYISGVKGYQSTAGPGAVDWNMRDHSALFLISVVDDKELEVEKIRFINQDENVSWAVACNQLQIRGDKTSFAITGSGLQQIVTNLAPGDYECTLNASSAVTLSNKLDHFTNSRQDQEYHTPIFTPSSDYVNFDFGTGIKDEYNAGFYLSSLSSQTPPILKVQPPPFEWLDADMLPVTWSMSCNSTELDITLEDPALKLNAGTQVLSQMGAGEGKVAFSQPKGFYMCGVSLVLDLKTRLKLGDDYKYPAIGLYAIYSQALPRQNNNALLKISVGQHQPYYAGNIYREFIINNGILDTYYVSEIELNISNAAPEHHEDVRWHLVCNSIQQNQQNADVSAQGFGRQYVVTNVKNGDYQCNIDVDIVEARSPSRTAPFMDISVHSFDYIDDEDSYSLYGVPRAHIGGYYSSTPLQGNHEFSFQHRKGDIPPIISVQPEGVQAEWNLSCAEIEPQDRKTEFVKSGNGNTVFITGVQPGAYSCNLQPDVSAITSAYLRNQTYDEFGLYSSGIYSDEDDIALTKDTPDATSIPFRFTNTSSLYSPEILVNISAEGDPAWTISCKQT